MHYKSPEYDDDDDDDDPDPANSTASLLYVVCCHWQFWFAMLSGFSGQVVFERWSIGLYNVVSCVALVCDSFFMMHCNRPGWHDYVRNGSCR